MNILYHTTGKLCATQGGTERTTITVATELKNSYGCRCFSIYERPASTPKEDCVEKEFLWDQRKHGNEEANIRFLREIIIENRINVVIVQGAFIHVRRFRQAAKGLDCKIIFAHHFQPCGELEFFKFKDLIRQRPKGFLPLLRWIKTIALYKQLRKKYEISLSEYYREAYENADKVVLLSKGFIPKYKEFGKFNQEEKFIIIPNGLSFGEFITEEAIVQKKRVVLIVARLEDLHKKLTVALRIWGKIKKNTEADGWTLKIVGTGVDEQIYKSIVSDEQIPDVYFEGRQNPLPYYKEASIFMMTSKSESWGLTLTESQQMGVVPIAFDTYESLRDIITDGEDGRIIAPGDIDGYTAAMLELMTNEEKRRQMAKRALQTCRRFTADKIAHLWWQVIS